MRLSRLLPLLVGVAACAGQSSPPPAGSDVSRWREAGPDAPADAPAQPREGLVWPDIAPERDGVQPAKDTPWPKSETYGGGPFGCQVDAECLGQRCCPTPWGVKLCAPTCDLK
jgi:hypothetical protein